MRTHQQSLIRLLTLPTNAPDQEIMNLLKGSEPEGLADIFVDLTFLLTSFRFIEEQYWIQNQKKANPLVFSNFVKKLFKPDLQPILFFHEAIERSSIEDMDLFKKKSQVIQNEVLQFCKKLNFPANKAFAERAIHLMSELFQFEYQLGMDKESSNEHLGYSLYRAFDCIDDFFKLDYAAEIANPVRLVSEERLYDGSGASVQSSYSVISLVLRYLKIAKGSRFVDLGSGYGRVGLAIGLLRPDLHFAGYEIIEDRVRMANETSHWLGVDQNVQFFTQDLSLENFSIPEAETYYMYDPFIEKTYQHISNQLNQMASQRQINVITKGHAQNSFLKYAPQGLWSIPQVFDKGNFAFIRSKV